MKPNRMLVCAAAILSAVFAVLQESSAADSNPEGLDTLYEKVVTSIVLVTDGLEEYNRFGSGVILHQDGYIATAAHVVETAERIGIQFKNGQKAEAKIVAISQHQDLALLKVEAIPDGMHVAKLGDSDTVKPGQKVFCIGAPRGLQFSVSAGIVSAVRKHVGDRYRLHSPDNLIQTDAAVNPGNSGGALFDMRGEVVGIAVKTVSGGDDADSAGLGLSVPSNLVRLHLIDDALPYLGLHLQRIPPRLAEVMNWPPFEALLVEGVRKGSFAEKAGMKGGIIRTTVAGLEVILGGDLIYEVDGIPVAEIERIHEHLHALKSGEKIKYTILRAGKISSVEVAVEKVHAIPKLDGGPAKKKKTPEEEEVPEKAG